MILLSIPDKITGNNTSSDEPKIKILIADDIVKKHNGDIMVESTVGKGTTFTVKIPVVEK